MISQKTPTFNFSLRRYVIYTLAILLLVIPQGLTIYAQGPVNPTDISIDLQNIFGDIHYNQERRFIFRNNNTASPITRAYEPAFLPFFNAAKSGPGKLALTIVLFDPNYGAAAFAAANIPDPHSIVLLPITGAVLSLGPKDPTAAPYTSIPARSFKNNNSDTIDVVFDVPEKTLEEVKALADSSALRVSYGISSQLVTTANCAISIQVTNNALFSNKINGPVTSGQTGSFSVSLTRNQFADAVSRGWITIRQSCQQGPGATPTQLTLARDDALRLLPVMIEQLAMQQRPFAEAMKEIANFSFNGQDAGTTINSYLTSLAQTIHNSSSDHIKVSGSGEANVLGIFGGKASGEVDKQHVEDNLNQQDFKFQWNGTQFIPASLNVVTVKSGSSTDVATLSAEQTVVTGSANVSRSFVVPVQEQTTASWAPTPVGAVIPFFLTPQEAATLKPTWLPADGSKVNDPFSPLNGRTLPNLTNRFIYGADATTDVTVVNDKTQGGTTALNTTLRIFGGSTGGSLWPNGKDNGSFIGTPPANTFVTDTGIDEKFAGHIHAIDNNFNVTGELSLPPYRRLIFMVRVR